MQLHSNISKFLLYMWLQYVTIINLNEKIDEQWTYFIHYWWLPLRFDNQLAYAIMLCINDEMAHDTFAIVILLIKVYIFIG
jgi:hypothetical protein